MALTYFKSKKNLLSLIINRFFGILLLISVVVLGAFYIIESQFNFSSYHVSGPDNEFLPLFRLSFLVFVLLYPFFGIVTWIIVHWASVQGQREEASSTITLKNVFILFIWTLIWPGIFIAIGLHFNYIQLLFDPKAFVNTDTGLLFWLLVFTIGRLLDPVPMLLTGQWDRPTFSMKYIVTYLQFFGINFAVTLFLIDIAIAVQLFTYLVTIMLVLPFIMSGLNIIGGIILFIAVPINMLFGYLAILYIRAIFFEVSREKLENYFQNKGH